MNQITFKCSIHLQVEDKNMKELAMNLVSVADSILKKAQNSCKQQYSCWLDL